jgi:glycosyltransferase involved in cell wall biosynthesis
VLTIGNRFPPEGLGGYEALWHDAVAWLSARGHAVTVLACDLPCTEDEQPVRRELRWYWREHEFPELGFRERLELERHNRSVLQRAVEDVSPDVVVWFSMGGMSLSLLGQVTELGLPAVGVIGDEWLAYGPKVDGWMRGWHRRPAPSAVRGIPTRYDPAQGCRWIFISKTLLERTLEYGIQPGRAEIVHPGVDRTLFAPGKTHEWRGDLLYAGRIDPRKGIATAVQALAALKDARLTIDGDGDHRHAQFLRTLATARGVSTRVAFTRTPRRLLPERYRAADAVLHPVQWQEPWGLVPLEAMAAGTPVVATGMGGSGEYLLDGENALLVAPDSPEELAGAVARLAGDPELRARLRDGGIATAASYRSSDFFAALERALEEESA